MSTHNMYSVRNKKNMWIPPLICSYEMSKNFIHFIPYPYCLILLLMQLFLKILSEKANSVDPDQTAPSGAV